MKRTLITLTAVVLFAILPGTAGALPTAVPAPSPLAGKPQPESLREPEAMSLADRDQLPALAPSGPVAVVKIPVLNVRKGPDTGYGVLTTAKQGTALAVLGQTNQCAWLNVQTPAGEGWVAGAARYVDLKAPCASIPAAELPAPVVRTSLGSVTVDEVELDRRFPSGCADDSWYCDVTNPGYLILAVWFATADGSDGSDISDPFFDTADNVTVVASNGNRTERYAGGFVGGRLVLAFIVESGEKDFKLCWPGNPCIYIGGSANQPDHTSGSPSEIGSNL